MTETPAVGGECLDAASAVQPKRPFAVLLFFFHNKYNAYSKSDISINYIGGLNYEKVIELKSYMLGKV
jgi:hypothetical protein